MNFISKCLNLEMFFFYFAMVIWCCCKSFTTLFQSAIKHTGEVEDIISPGCKRKKKTSTPKIQKEYSDDGLFGYTVSNIKAVSHGYILFVYTCMV